MMHMPFFLRSFFLGLFVVAIAMSWSTLPAIAQTFVEPTSPGGDTTAWPLNSSSNPQFKRGSLIIGSSTTQAKLCLNTDDYDDAVNCISSWNQLSGTYVRLQTTIPATPTDPLSYGTADPGYAHIKGNAGQLFSIVAEANTAAGNATGIYASDGGQAANFAAYFEGNVLVQNAGNTAKLCLNDVADLSATTGKGCIDSWSDLASIASAGTYVVLQPMTSTPSPQPGQVGVSGGASVAQIAQSAVVIGAPTSTTDPLYTCGDAICNGSETAASCAIDCDVTPPSNVTSPQVDNFFVNAFNPSIFGVMINWADPSPLIPGNADFAGVRVIRSTTIATDPYKTDYPSMASWDITPGVGTVNDNNLSRGTTYFYSFFSYDTSLNYSSGVQLTVYLAPAGGTSGGCSTRFCIPM